MALSARLPHILAAMALILAAGILGVRYLEEVQGGATVPGVVLVEALWLTSPELEALGAALGGGEAGRVTVGSGALAPFDLDLVRRLRRRGDSTTLYIADRAFDRDALPADGSAWRTILDAYEPGSGAPTAVAAAADYVRSQRSTRAFLVAVALGAAPPSVPPASLLAPLLSALGELPAFRRSSLLVLGARQDGERAYLRLDVGPWKGRARPLLEDLLEGRW